MQENLVRVAHLGGGTGSTGGSTGAVMYPEFFVSDGNLYYRGTPQITYTAFDGEVWCSTTANACGYTNLRFWGYNTNLYRVTEQGGRVLVKQTPEFGTVPSKPEPTCPF